MDRKRTIFNVLMYAAEQSFKQLFSDKNEHFYYCTLVMMDCSVPCISAMSEESLTRLLEENADGEISSDKDKAYFRWSYADSPYCGYGYDEYFTEVSDFFSYDITDDLSEEEYEERICDWLEEMREVMKALKDKGIFKDKCTENVFLIAEQQPPESDINTENARYLNDDEGFKNWYRDNKAEYEEIEQY